MHFRKWGNNVYWIGIDGGGTKTEILVTDEVGTPIVQKKIGTISYRQIGIEESVLLLSDVLNQILNNSGIYKEEIYGTCCAFPNWGESKESDVCLREQIRKHLQEYRIYPVNDCEVGWAGSLGMDSGINLVAGTGAIAYGRDNHGNTARAGGWSEGFSDEGSCNWLGKKTLELFSKESDGRAKSSALLDIMREYFELTDDYEIVDIYEHYYRKDRTKTAGLQRLLLEAAKEGDEEAVELYVQGAKELASAVLAVYEKLTFEKMCIVSYSGGLFHAGEYVMQPLKKALEGKKIKIKEPLFLPCQGGVLLAASYWGNHEMMRRIKDNWAKWNIVMEEKQ